MRLRAYPAAGGVLLLVDTANRVRHSIVFAEGSDPVLEPIERQLLEQMMTLINTHGLEVDET